MCCLAYYTGNMGVPLNGVEVLDIGTLTPGKYCSFLLAELGARVLRVERPTTASPVLSPEDLHLNRGKRSITLNLGDEAGRRILYRLVEPADVVLESHRPGVARRIGIDYEALRGRNGRLVYCSLSGFGQEGPYRGQAAYDLTLVGLSGLLRALLGEGVAPQPPGAYLADAVSGLVAALAISSALLERERTGEGRYLDLAMLDAVFSLLSVSHGVRLASGETPAAPSTTPLYHVYKAADGRYVTLAAIRPASCRALFEALGRPDLIERAWSTGDEAEEVYAFLRDTFRSAPAATWVERLGQLDVEIGPVRSPAEAFDDVQLRFRRMVIESAHPRAGRHLQIASPFGQASDGALPPLSHAPVVGADTEPVLSDLGYTTQEITRLREAGTV